jgi:homocysteine S-methyltransferase
MLIEPFLRTAGVLVIDGALASELERRGADLADELWSARLLLEAPELIRAVHADYFAAGADVAITASYQASFEGFARRGLSRTEATRLLQRSVSLACEARDAFWSDPAKRTGRLRPLVAASVGPYGAFLADGSEYHGEYGLTREELMDWHRPRMAVLAAAGADLLAFETIPCRVEAEALLALLREFPEMPAWLSFSCRDERHIAHGEDFAECVALAAAYEQIVAVGLNCTPPRYVEALLRHARSATQKPLLAYPNSGEAWDPRAKCWVTGSGTTEFTEPARRWYAAGARLIGGCCRTTPADIRAIATALRRNRSGTTAHSPAAE